MRARWLWPAAAGVAVAAVVVALMPRAYVGVFYDDGIYLSLARSLAEGHGYRLLYLPGAPVAVHYPPLYPLFLAALWKLWSAFPDNVVLFRAANGVLLGLFTGGFAAYLAWRRTLPVGGAALSVAAGATAIPLLAVATALFAEPLFLVFAVGAWWLGDAARGSAPGRRAALLAASAGVLAGLAALTRSIGIAVVGGVVLALVLERRWRGALLAALGALALVAPWTAWSAARSGAVPSVLALNYGTYAAVLHQAGWGALSVDGLWEVLRPLGAIALATVKEAWRPVFGAPSLVVLVAGAVAVGRRAPALGWSLACYFGVVLLWPYGPDRFLWAVVPALLVAMVVGTLSLWRAAAARAGWRRWALRALVLAGALPVAAGFGRYQVLGVARGFATSAQLGISGTFDQVVPWVKSATPSSAILASEDEALLWLYTGRRAVPSFLWHLEGRNARSFGPDTLRAYLKRSGVTHVLLTGPRSEAAATLDELVGRYPGYLRIVMMWPGPITAFAVMERSTTDAPPPSR